MAAAIEIHGVSKRFMLRHNRANSFRQKLIGLYRPDRRERREKFWVLRDVNLNIPKGESFALLGANGSGKSTLLKLIAGTMPPTSGKIQVDGTVAPMIELGIGFHPELSGKDNIFLNASLYGWTREDTEQVYDQIVEFSDLGKFLDAPLRAYSSGMRARLAFATASHLEADILLIDEVLAVGDEAFQQRCLARIERLRGQGRTMVFVSHNLQQIENICTRGALLSRGLVSASGPIREVIDAHHTEQARLAASAGSARPPSTP